MNTTSTQNIEITEMKKVINHLHCHVRFSTEIRFFTIPNRSELPCTQEYYANYAVCKKQFIEQTYMIRNGNLVGFNYTLELQNHNKSEMELEKEIEKEFPIQEDDEDDEEDDLKKM